MSVQLLRGNRHEKYILRSLKNVQLKFQTSCSEESLNFQKGLQWSGQRRETQQLLFSVILFCIRNCQFECLTHNHLVSVLSVYSLRKTVTVHIYINFHSEGLIVPSAQQGCLGALLHAEL